MEPLQYKEHRYVLYDYKKFQLQCFGIYIL
jgi:hypothetical protein